MAQITARGTVSMTVSGDLSVANKIELGKGDCLFFVSSVTTTITWYGPTTTAGTAAEYYENNAALTQAVTAGKPTAMPTFLNGADWVLPIGGSAGTIYYTIKQMHG